VSDVLVLCYHALSERWPAALSTTPALFERQLELLVRRGYRGATFIEAVTAPPAPRTLAVTFDDAYRSVLELALPIMERLGIPGSVYVPTAFAGAAGPMSWEGIAQWVGGEHEHELRCMDWDELRVLAERGWEIGSHTRSHPRLTRLDDAELAGELGGSLEECAAGLGEPCRSLAYPYGDVDARVMDAARAAGYEAAAALPDGRLPRPTPLAWPRVGVYRVDDMRRFRLKVSRPLRRLRGSRIWDLVDRAR
jgi:peptidoglycan/xylan/chitin deacetylase (PgdA/CDA1 family)